MKSFLFGGTNPFLGVTSIAATDHPSSGSATKRPSLSAITLARPDQAAPNSNPSSSNGSHYFSEPDEPEPSCYLDKKRKTKHESEMSSFERLLFLDKENISPSCKRALRASPNLSALTSSCFLDNPFFVLSKNGASRPADLLLRSPFKLHSPLRLESAAAMLSSSPSSRHDGARQPLQLPVSENPFLVPSTNVLAPSEPSGTKMNIHRPSLILEKLLSEPDISASQCQNNSIESLASMILSDLRSELSEEPVISLPTTAGNANEDRFPNSKSPNSLLLEWINEEALSS